MKNKTQLIKAIENEIDKINKKIDLKIAKGMPYTQEGRKHKQLRDVLASYS